MSTKQQEFADHITCDGAHLGLEEDIPLGTQIVSNHTGDYQFPSMKLPDNDLISLAEQGLPEG